MISSSWHHIKAINIKLCNIGEKKFFIFFCDIPSGRRFYSCSFFELIFSIIGIRNQVSYISNIHNRNYRISQIFKCISNQISSKSCPKIPNMRSRIHSRTTRIKSDFVFFIRWISKKWDKILLGTRKGIVELQRFHLKISQNKSLLD